MVEHDGEARWTTWEDEFRDELHLEWNESLYEPSQPIVYLSVSAWNDACNSIVLRRSQVEEIKEYLEAWLKAHE